MDIEPIQKALDSTTAHVAGVSISGMAWIGYMDITMKIAGLLYVILLIVGQGQKVYSNYRLRKKGKSKELTSKD